MKPGVSEHWDSCSQERSRCKALQFPDYRALAQCSAMQCKVYSCRWQDKGPGAGRRFDWGRLMEIGDVAFPGESRMLVEDADGWGIIVLWAQNGLWWARVASGSLRRVRGCVRGVMAMAMVV